MNKAVIQHYWERQAQTVQPPKAADKPLEEKQEQQSFLSMLKKQSTEDRITTVLCILICMFGAAMIVTQIGKWQGW